MIINNFKKIRKIHTNPLSLIKKYQNFTKRQKSFTPKSNTYHLSNNVNNNEELNLFNFKKILEKNFPIKLGKNFCPKSDENLTTFIQLDKIINKTKAIAVTKNFIDNLFKIINSNESSIDFLNDEYFSKYCEENLINKINSNLQSISFVNKDPGADFKFKIFLVNENDNYFSKKKDNFFENIPLYTKKLNFNVNLYNIKNLISLGVDCNRKTAKNLKLINYNKDILINNPLDAKNSIKTDILTYRETFRLLPDPEKIPLTLISQLFFSAIPTQKTKLVVVIKDFVDESTLTYEYPIYNVDLIAEYEILKMNYKEFMKIDENLEKLITDENLIKNEEQFELDEYNLKVMKYLESSINNEKFCFDLKLIDVDDLMSGNKII